MIIALDTATARATVALGDAEGGLLAEDAWAVGSRHGEELIARLDGTLRSAGLSLSDAQAVVVGLGPGAFTGIRVGLATAKALAHARGIPILGISTGDALCHAAREVLGDPEAAVLIVLPAGPSARYVIGSPDGPEVVDRAEVEARARGRIAVGIDLGGDEAAAFGGVPIGEQVRARLGVELLRRGAARLKAGERDDLARLVPEYVTLPRGIREVRGTVEWSRTLL